MFLYKVQESQTRTCHQILCLNAHPFTHNKNTHTQTHMLEDEAFVESEPAVIMALTFG